MKFKQLKKRIVRVFKHYKKPMIIGAILVSLTTMLMYKRPMHAASDRAKTAVGVIFGAGVGGGIAGGVGGAKWLPLGFGVGGLAGGLLARAIRKNRERRNGTIPEPVDYQPRMRRNGRYRNQYQMNQGMYQPQPMQQTSPVYGNQNYNGMSY